MTPINIMVNGNPGNVAQTITKHLIKDPRFYFIPYSLTGDEIRKELLTIADCTIHLIHPSKRETMMDTIKKKYGAFISIDYTHPLSVNDNARFYTVNQLPFIMGTTGGDREKLMETVLNSKIAAVIAPNMAKQIVGLQAMMEYAANTFPDLFKGFEMKVTESHQQQKADTSGTAKAMIAYFNQMGIEFGENEIQKVRAPEEQKKLGIREEHLGGHGWHTYTLTSNDKNTTFEFTHNINGRDIYANGTIDAILYLDKKVRQGQKGVVYSMIDVLKNR